MSEWQTIESAPDEDVIYVFGRHTDGTPWWSIGTKWGDEWDGQWLPSLTPTHWQPLPTPPEEQK